MPLKPKTFSYSPPLTKSKVQDIQEPGSYSHRAYGLRLVVSKTGCKSFVIKAKPKGGGKTVTYTIGTFPNYSVEAAVEEARKRYEEIRQGNNPTQVRKALAAEAELEAKAIAIRHALTLEAAMKLFEDGSDSSFSTKHTYRIVLRRHLVEWLQVPMVQLTESMVLKKHNELKQTSASLSKLTFSALSSVFAVCQRHPDTKELIRANPVVIVGQNKAWSKPVARKVVLGGGELRKWAAAMNELGDTTASDYFWLLLLTGLRKQTLAELKWEDFDAENSLLNIPAGLDKGGRAWQLPLGKAASDCFKRRLAEAKTEAIFSGKRNARYFNCRPKVYKPIAEALGVAFTPHVTRHTFLTCAGSLVPELLVKRLANHSNAGNVIAFSYFKPAIETLREAMQKVEDSLLTATNMTPESFGTGNGAHASGTFKHSEKLYATSGTGIHAV